MRQAFKVKERGRELRMASPQMELQEGTQTATQFSTTGISSQIRTKLRDWAAWQERAGCYSLRQHCPQMTQRRCTVENI